MGKFCALALGASITCAFSSPALAVDILDFEGVGNNNPVGDFYAPAYSFSPATLAIVDEDAGGTGNFANEPSPNTTMYFLDANNAVLNAIAGFDTGFSFFYSSATAASVSVWSDFNASGTLLATLNLASQHDAGCTGDPTGTYCNWSAVGVTFNGMARSIDFGGTANATGFDDITFGSATPGIPEPSTWALMLLGFGALGSILRRRRVKFALA